MKKHKQKTYSVEELVAKPNDKLKNYADEINHLQTEIVANDTLSISHSKLALNLVIAAGGKLNEVKELLKHGDWENWLSKNVPCISKRTAQNYMLLAKKAANKQYGADLTDVESLRQAYIRAGIINEKPKAEQVEHEATPEEVKKGNPTLYQATLGKVNIEIVGLVQTIIKENEKAKWDVSKWTLGQDGAPRFRDEGTTTCLKAFSAFIAERKYNEQIIHADEVERKASAVLDEVFKAIIMAKSEPQSEVPNMDGLLPILNVSIPLEAKCETVDLTELATA